MKRKIKNLNYLAFIITLVLCATLSFSVKAQKIPLVLQNDSVLSPVGAYNAEAIAYRNMPSKDSRNRLIFMAVSQIDLNFGHYVKNKRHHNAFFQTVLDILEVGAATAISISNGERAKSVIADALGFVQGSRTKINENLRLLEQQVLVNKMIEKRSLALIVIYEKINNPIDQYPFERAYIDILAYYEAGTTDSALSSLATDTGSNAKIAEQKLREVKDQPITTTAIPEDLEGAERAFNVEDKLETNLGDTNKKMAALEKLQKMVGKLSEDKEILKLLNAKNISPTTDDGMKIINSLDEIKENATIFNRRDLVRKINSVIFELGTQN